MSSVSQHQVKPLCVNHQVQFLQQMKKLLNDPSTSDTKIIVGPSKKLFHAHSLILCSQSHVFKRMLFDEDTQLESITSQSSHYGSPRNMKQRQGSQIFEIQLLAGDPITFIDFLEYIYTGMCTITTKNAIHLLYLANHFDFKELMSDTIQFVKECLSIQNVLEILECSLLCKEEGLMDACWDIIDDHFEKVAATPTFLDISTETIISIVQRETLQIDEFKLFEAVIEWAKTAYEFHGSRRRDQIISISRLSSPSKANMGLPKKAANAIQTFPSSPTLGDISFKQFVQPILQYIRFPLMNSKQLVDIIKPMDIIPQEWYVQALEFNVTPDQFDPKLPQFRPRKKNRLAPIHKK